MKFQTNFQPKNEQYREEVSLSFKMRIEAVCLLSKQLFEMVSLQAKSKFSTPLSLTKASF